MSPSAALCSRFGTAATVLRHTGCDPAAVDGACDGLCCPCLTSQIRCGATTPGSSSCSATRSNAALCTAVQADGRPATAFGAAVELGSRQMNAVRTIRDGCSTVYQLPSQRVRPDCESGTRQRKWLDPQNACMRVFDNSQYLKLQYLSAGRAQHQLRLRPVAATEALSQRSCLKSWVFLQGDHCT